MQRDKGALLQNAKTPVAATQHIVVQAAKLPKGIGMKMERKAFPGEWKADGATGTVEGYGAVFGNIDTYGDIILKGAFSETMGRRKVKMLWQHDPGQPIGVWDEMREDDRGLYMKGRILPGVSKGKEAIELMSAGAIEGLSIGYRTVDAEYKEGNRYIKEIDLWETSIVTFPANEMAGASIKSIQTERDLECVLIDCGLSRKAAKAIASNGKGYLALRDADGGNPDDDLRDAGLVEALKQVATALKGKPHGGS
jgi:HK97 family phage prohead protease